MAKTRKIPLRKSVVSGEIIDKRDLLRIVKNKEGQVFIDPTGKANGCRGRSGQEKTSFQSCF